MRAQMWRMFTVCGVFSASECGGTSEFWDRGSIN